MRKNISIFVVTAALVSACTGLDTPSTPSSSSSGSSVQSSPVPGSNNGGNNNQPGRVELKGIVTGLGGRCPAISFNVSGSPIMTSATTVFDDGACSTLKNGDQVEVVGVRQTNNVVLADRVEDENDDDDDDNDDDHRHGGEARLEGAIGALGGACPSITFTVSGSTVSTSASTRFDNACSSLKNGDRVEVRGVRQSNNAVAASRVEKKK